MPTKTHRNREADEISFANRVRRSFHSQPFRVWLNYSHASFILYASQSYEEAAGVAADTAEGTELSCTLVHQRHHFEPMVEVFN